VALRLWRKTYVSISHVLILPFSISVWICIDLSLLLRCQGVDSGKCRMSGRFTLKTKIQQSRSSTTFEELKCATFQVLIRF